MLKVQGGSLTHTHHPKVFLKTGGGVLNIGAAEHVAFFIFLFLT